MPFDGKDAMPSLDYYPVARFLQEIVEPTVQEFLQDPTNPRRGMLAALAVNSLADHIAVARGLTEVQEQSEFRASLAGLHTNYGLVRDVADAAKHKTVGRKSASLIDIARISIETRISPDIIDPDGHPHRDQGIVLLGDTWVLEAGTPDKWTLPRRLDEIITSALQFLKQQM